MAALGDLLYRAASLWTRLSGNITGTRQFLSQTGTGAVSAAPAWAQVTDADLSTSNITTNNVTIAKHGFAPILPNDATKFLDGTGAYTVPPGTGTGTVTTTGSPASGNLSKFSGATSITNADLTGDLTTSGGVATTLAASGVAAATYGDATHVAQVTFDAKGRATGASNVAITPGSPAVPIVVSTNTVVAAGAGMVIPESLEIAGGVSLEIAGGARVEVTGSAGVPLFGYTPPVLSGFSWINQGGAWATQGSNGIYLFAPASATTNLRVLVQSAPATPYLITAVINRIAPSINSTHQGIVFRESSSGKLYGLFVQSGAAIGNYVIAADNYASPTSASDGAFELASIPSNQIYLRMGDDGTNRTTWWSADGVNYQLLTSVGRTSTMTANQVGFYVKTETGSGVNVAAMTLLSWKVA